MNDDFKLIISRALGPIVLLEHLMYNQRKDWLGFLGHARQ